MTIRFFSILLPLLLPATVDAASMTFNLAAGPIGSGHYATVEPGLVPMIGGTSLQGSGVGIGVPVLTFDGNDYYPGASDTSTGSYEKSKVFHYTRMRSGNRFVPADRTIGQLTVRYTILADKIRVVIMFDRLHIEPLAVRILNQFSADRFPRYEGSGLEILLNGGRYTDAVVNTGCGQGMGDDTGWFRTDDRTVAMGARCRDGWRLVRSRRPAGRNLASLDFTGYAGRAFSYDIYFSTPANSNRFWAPIVD